MHSVKALRVKQANIKVKNIMATHKKAQVKRKSARDLKNLSILLKNSTDGLESRSEHRWGYVSMRIHSKCGRIFPLKVGLVVQGRIQLEHSSHIVMVGV